jgi:ATP:ADP antiporter, AAA family
MTLTTVKTLAGRLLSPIAEVHPGEGLTTVLLAIVLFLVLAAYDMLETVRESLILTESGAAVKSYSSAGEALLLLDLVPAFGAFTRQTVVQP